MAYLLVHTGDASGAENYGLALVWISPFQAWASTMEEAVGTLSACISQWTQLAICSCTVV